tara:strand:+ start:11738 stop:12022 length:285 start_codon:yes stop_codon:yes gene_type:complete
MKICKTLTHTIKRNNPNDEQIVIDHVNNVINIVGQTISFRAPISSVSLDEYELTEGGILRIQSENTFLNVDLSLAEYIQAFHYFSGMNESQEIL